MVLVIALLVGMLPIIPAVIYFLRRRKRGLFRPRGV